MVSNDENNSHHTASSRRPRKSVQKTSQTKQNNHLRAGIPKQLNI
jgi:hypothetical protein